MGKVSDSLNNLMLTASVKESLILLNALLTGNNKVAEEELGDFLKVLFAGNRF